MRWSQTGGNIHYTRRPRRLATMGPRTECQGFGNGNALSALHETHVYILNASGAAASARRAPTAHCVDCLHAHTIQSGSPRRHQPLQTLSSDSDSHRSGCAHSLILMRCSRRLITPNPRVHLRILDSKAGQKGTCRNPTACCVTLYSSQATGAGHRPPPIVPNPRVHLRILDSPKAGQKGTCHNTTTVRPLVRAKGRQPVPQSHD
jgi:hypothetical protein